MGSKIARELKWDLCLETRRGKCNRASREPERAPLGAKMASQCMLRLTLPCAQVAQAELRPSSGQAQAKLRHAQECSPSAQVKAAAAHVYTLKRNQRKKRLSLTYVVFTENYITTSFLVTCLYKECPLLKPSRLIMLRLNP